MPTSPATTSLQRSAVAGRHAGSARMAQRVTVLSRAVCRPRVSVEAARAPPRRRQLSHGTTYYVSAKSDDAETSPASAEAEEEPAAAEGEEGEEFAGSSDESDLEYGLGGETFEGSLDGSGLRIGIVVARFNELVTRPLLEGAKSALERHWVDVDNDVDVAWVPGAFELPIVAKAMAKSGKYDAVIAIGTVVRGSTGHYDAVVGGATSGVLGAGVDTGVPVVFNVLTCDTMEQAMDRAGGKAGNKGAESAATAVEMANLLASMREEGVAADPW